MHHPTFWPKRDIPAKRWLPAVWKRPAGSPRVSEQVKYSFPNWNVHLRNDAAPRFFNCFIDLEKRPTPRNLLHLMFDPEGMRPFIANWEDVAASLIQRVNRESVGRVTDQKTKELLEALQAYPEFRTELKKPQASNILPFIPISFVKKGKKINFFSMITTVGGASPIC